MCLASETEYEGSIEEIVDVDDFQGDVPIGLYEGGMEVSDIFELVEEPVQAVSSLVAPSKKAMAAREIKARKAASSRAETESDAIQISNAKSGGALCPVMMMVLKLPFV